MTRVYLKALLKKHSIPRIIAVHLFGKQHRLGHRMAIGTVIMAGGVLLAKVFESGPLHLMFDGIGYLIHGMGATPWAEWFIGLSGDPDKNTKS